MNCSTCNLKIWSTDKGICPKCSPDENRKVYNLLPPVNLTEVSKPPIESNRKLITTSTKTLEDVTKDYILKVYFESDRNKTRTAKLLGISTKGLYNRLNMYGVM